MFSIINTTYGTKVVFFLQLGHFYTANILLIYALCLYWHNYYLRKWLIVRCVAKTYLFYNVKVIMIRGFKLRI